MKKKIVNHQTAKGSGDRIGSTQITNRTRLKTVKVFKLTRQTRRSEAGVTFSWIVIYLIGRCVFTMWRQEPACETVLEVHVPRTFTRRQTKIFEWLTQSRNVFITEYFRGQPTYQRLIIFLAQGNFFLVSYCCSGNKGEMKVCFRDALRSALQLMMMWLPLYCLNVCLLKLVG